MSDKSVTLQIPDDLYQRMQQAAQTTQQTLETMLLDSMQKLFGAAADRQEPAPGSTEVTSEDLPSNRRPGTA